MSKSQDNLLAAAKQALRFIPDPHGALASFEDVGEWFYSDTGMLAPGKDEAAASSLTSFEDRKRAFTAWRNAKALKVRRDLEDAIEAVEDR